MSEPADGGPWSQPTQDRWFYGFLAVSVASVGLLFLPYLDALLFAATTVVVTWPVFTRVLVRCGDRRLLASAVTSLLVFGLVLVPNTLLALWFVQQALDLTQQAMQFVASGEAQELLDEGLTSLEFLGVLQTDDPMAMVMEALQDAMFTIAQAMGTVVPGLVGSVVEITFDGTVYVFAVVTLYAEGPRLARALMQLSPMNDSYEQRLFLVFREFSNNLVIGSLATAAIQGAVAGLGFWLVGIEQVVFFAMLTAVMSFVPVIGTAVVWVPLVAYVTATQGGGWGFVLAMWNMMLTGTVDNVMRPLFLRGQSNIHPLLIFLAVLGGISWMGVPGALIGPVLVAAFLALFTIYREDYLGLEPGPPPARGQGWVDQGVERVAGALGLELPGSSPPSDPHDAS